MNELSDSEIERYARQIVLREVGGVGQRRLKSASIAIVGAGGIGSAAIPALAGAGVGRLTIIDDDVVQRSDLQRQTMYRDDQVGQRKAELAARFAQSLNPDVNASARDSRLAGDNAEGLLVGHDLVLDGSDNFATRLIVSDTVTRAQIPLASGSAAQLQAQVGLFRGWEPDKPCYRCFVGDAFDSDDCDNCAELGVLGALVGMAGQFAALLAIQAIVGFGADAAGKLHIFDGVSGSWRAVRVPKEPGCRACGGSDAAYS